MVAAMSKLTPLQMQKRAARRNPAWHPADLFRISQDNGATVFQDNGELQFDLIEQTFAMIDRTKETMFDASDTYQGSHLVAVLSDVPPNTLALIKVEGRFYSVNSLHSADVMNVAVRYDCNAMADDEAPTIRTTT